MTDIPPLGFGVWQVPDGPECEQAVRWALELGYRHVDTAQAYGNERSVGNALRDSGVPREDVFITTKFYPARDDPAREAERSLERLGLEYLDLYIIHWPQGGPTWAWPGMERAYEQGHARAIGVSNFSLAEIDELLAVAGVRPAANQRHDFKHVSLGDWCLRLLRPCDEPLVELNRHVFDPKAQVANQLRNG